MHEPALHHSAPRPSSRICSECGTPAPLAPTAASSPTSSDSAPAPDDNDGRTLRRARTRRQRWLPILAAALVLFGFAYRGYRERTTGTGPGWPSAYIFDFPSPHPAAVAPDSHLRAIADNPRSGDRMLRAALDRAGPVRGDPREITINAFWKTTGLPGYAERLDGWPLTFRATTLWHNSPDSFEQLIHDLAEPLKPPSPASVSSAPAPAPPATNYITQRIWVFTGDLLRSESESVLQTGGWTTRSSVRLPLAIPAALFIVALCAHVASRASALIARRRRDRRRIQQRAAVIAAMIAIAAIATLWTTSRRTSLRESWWSAPPNSTTIHTLTRTDGADALGQAPEHPLTMRELKTWVGLPDADAKLARCLLSALGTAPSTTAGAVLHGTPAGYLAGMSTLYGSPYPWLCLRREYSRGVAATGQSGAPRWPASGLFISPDNRGWLRIDLPVAKDAVTRTAWIINLPIALTIALIVYAAYWATWSACYGLAAINAWRWRRANRCDHCGYPLAPA